MKLHTSLILKKADEIENDAERADFLRPHMTSTPLKIALASLFNQEIEFFKYYGNIEPRNRNNRLGFSDSSFENVSKRLYLFLNETDIPKEKKLELLTKILESLAPEDAELLQNIVKKKNVYKNIGRVFIKNHFPELLTMKLPK